MSTDNVPGTWARETGSGEPKRTPPPPPPSPSRQSPLQVDPQGGKLIELAEELAQMRRERDELRAHRDRLRDTVVWVLENVDELEGSWHETVEDMSGVTL